MRIFLVRWGEKSGKQERRGRAAWGPGKGVRAAAWALLLALGTWGGWGSGQAVRPASAAPAGYLCIVIDDFGYDGNGTAEMLALDIPLTAAIMPFSAHSAEDAQRVAAAGTEAIIHMPMESLTGKPEWVGEKGVFVGMTAEEIAQRVAEALEVVPEAVGMNNHMGSAVMEDEAALSAVIQAAAEHGLIFLDSLTTPRSQAEKLCAQAGVPLLCRSVFLDSTSDIAMVRQQLETAARMAREKGSALAIGHVGPEGGSITAQAIAELAPRFQEEGLVFVTVSQLAGLLAEEGAAGLYKYDEKQKF